MGEERHFNLQGHECLAPTRRDIIEAMRGRIIELEMLAATDALTGLWNRSCFDRMIPIEINRSLRSGLPLSMIFFDVDHFKNINDHHGHSVGDDILRELARLTSQLIRSTDIPFRWGGEEFVIPAPSTDATGITRLAQKLCLTVAAHDFPGIPPPLTITAGVSAWRQSESAAQWFARVDALMHEGKQSGRNRVCAAP